MAAVTSCASIGLSSDNVLLGLRRFRRRIIRRRTWSRSSFSISSFDAEAEEDDGIAGNEDGEVVLVEGPPSALGGDALSSAARQNSDAAHICVSCDGARVTCPQSLATAAAPPSPLLAFSSPPATSSSTDHASELPNAAANATTAAACSPRICASTGFDSSQTAATSFAVVEPPRAAAVNAVDVAAAEGDAE